MQKNKIILGLILLFVMAYSFATLTTKPKFWYDEGLNIEMAKNFSEFGVMDVQLSLGEFSGIPYILQSTGYTVLAPLSWFFDIFGFGPGQARAYMLLWMVVALLSIYLFVKKLSGPKEALFAVALVATFASFYGNGRTVMGEIPGFVFLLWALYLALFKNRYFWSGLLFGLAIVTKPSVYITILPAILVLLFFSKKFFKNSFLIFCGLAPPIVVKILFGISNPFSAGAWVGMLNLLKNPFGSDTSPWAYLLKNLLAIPSSTTLIYFISLLLLVIFVKRFSGHHSSHYSVHQKVFYYFSLTYIFFAFLYYLKSPGWLRYLIVAELLILILFAFFAGKLRKKLFYGIMILLVGLQCFQLFFLSDLYSSEGVEKVTVLIEKDFPDSSVGLLNIPQLAAFIPSGQKHQVLYIDGVGQLGKNLLSYDPPLDVIVSADEVDLPSYELFADFGDYKVYVYENAENRK